MGNHIDCIKEIIDWGGDINRVNKLDELPFDCCNISTREQYAALSGLLLKKRSQQEEDEGKEEEGKEEEEGYDRKQEEKPQPQPHAPRPPVRPRPEGSGRPHGSTPVQLQARSLTPTPPRSPRDMAAADSPGDGEEYGDDFQEEEGEGDRSRD